MISLYYKGDLLNIGLSLNNMSINKPILFDGMRTEETQNEFRAASTFILERDLSRGDISQLQ